jgi:hypothetical protein
MDYVKIYDQFILDRRNNPPSINEYTELHHIVPRCMGGCNSKGNLIRLRPGDHFFAHLCLAKAYGSPLLWMAVFALLRFYKNRPKDNRAFACSVGRRTYEWLAGHRPSGANHPGADLKVYHFKHASGEEARCTRSALVEVYGVDRNGLTQVMAGQGVSANGWFLADKNPSGLTGHALTSGDYNGCADRTVYSFQHRDGRSASMTRAGMRREYGLTHGQLDTLVSGKNRVCDGWFLPEKNPSGLGRSEFYTGEMNNKFDHNIYDFVHVDGRVDSGTMYAMHKRHGGGRPSWTQVVNKGTSSLGWRLSTSPIRKRTGRGGGKTFSFANSDGRVFCGTQQEFSQSVGCSPATACHVSHGRVAYRGWISS